MLGSANGEQAKTGLVGSDGRDSGRVVGKQEVIRAANLVGTRVSWRNIAISLIDAGAARPILNER